MPLKVTRAGAQEKNAVERLLCMSLHEVSEQRHMEIDTDGLYPFEDFETYFNDPGRSAYFIRVKEKIAGIILVREFEGLDGKPISTISHIFLLHMYRELGIAEESLRTVMDLHPGNWVVSLPEDLTGAAQFFKKVVHRYAPGRYKQTTVADSPTAILAFQSPATGQILSAAELPAARPLGRTQVSEA